MSEATSNRNETTPEMSLSQRLKRAAIAALFFLILLIPRIRRLRRRVRAWTAIRIALGVAGLLLGWRFFSASGAAFALGSLALILFAVAVRATPVVKSLDEMARELGALVVLNGGTFVSESGESSPGAHIFAGVDRLIVVDAHSRLLREIPTAKVQRCVARPTELAGAEPHEGGGWQLEITWDSGAPQTAQFRFEGFFAEHLARVAESTIAHLRRRELPVLKT